MLGGGFQYDDFLVILEEPGVHSLGAWAAGLGGLRPLLKLSYTLNWMADPGPGGFLAVNLGLHLLNVWMVQQLLLKVGAWTGLERRRAGFAAFAGAMVFALHPLQTESVAYVSGRSSALAASLVLGSVLAYLHSRDGRGPGFVSPALFVLAVLAKETALALPLALTVLEACRRDGRRPRVGPWPHWSLAAAGAVALALHPGYRRFLASSLGLRGLGPQLRGSAEGCAYLFRQMVWPAGLNIDPPLSLPPAWDLRLAAWGLLLLGLAASGLWALRRRPWLAFGLLWGLLWLLPTQGPVPRLDLANERHLYLSLAGFGFLLGMGLAALPVRTAGLAAVALALGVTTFRRVPDYRDEVRLWRASLAVAPVNPRAWNNLGVALQNRGDRAGAASAFAEALRLRPGYDLAQHNLQALRAADLPGGQPCPGLP